MVDLALYAHDDWFGAAGVDLAAVSGEDETARAFLARHAAALAPKAATGIADEILAAFGLAPDAPARDSTPDDRRKAASSAIALAAMTPEILLR